MGCALPLGGGRRPAPPSLVLHRAQVLGEGGLRSGVRAPLCGAPRGGGTVRGRGPRQGSLGARPGPGGRHAGHPAPTPTPRPRGRTVGRGTPAPPPRAFREPLREASVDRDSRHASGDKPVSATGLALEAARPVAAPLEEFVGKVKRSLHLGTGVCAHSLKHSLLPTWRKELARHLGLSARRLWPRVLAAEPGAGRGAARGAWAGLGGRTRRRGGAEVAPRSPRALPGPAFRRPPARGEPPPRSWRPGPRAQSGPAPGASSPSPGSPGSPGSALGPRGGAGWRRRGPPLEAGDQMPGCSGRQRGGAAGSPTSAHVRVSAAGGGGRETRAPAAPSADPEEPARRREAPALGDDARTSPPPGVLSAPGAPRQPQAAAAARGERHQTGGDPERPQSEARSERGASQNLEGWQRRGRGVGNGQGALSHGYPPSS